jgi:hypothetical protein
MKLVFALITVLAIGLIFLLVVSLLDRRADRAEWDRLAALQPEDPELFDPAMVAGLPEPAHRYFGYTIRPGAPLLPVVEIDMREQFSLGNRDAPNYQPMDARQILVAPDGFVWAMRARGGIPVAGSDSCRWTRFRLLGLIPVARAGGDTDHARSAFGRCIGEAAISSPAALLAGPGVAWSADDGDTARVTVTRGDLVQTVDVTVDAEGRPVEIPFQRWTNANPDRACRLQPFGAVMSDFREVGGYRLPFHVETGNMFGTEAYFPFFVAEVTDIRFPGVRR